MHACMCRRQDIFIGIGILATLAVIIAMCCCRRSGLCGKGGGDGGGNDVHVYSAFINALFARTEPEDDADPPGYIARPAPAVHRNIVCDGSNVNPIVGIRYHRIGEDYDLCQVFRRLDVCPFSSAGQCAM